MLVLFHPSVPSLILTILFVLTLPMTPRSIYQVEEGQIGDHGWIHVKSKDRVSNKRDPAPSGSMFV